MARILKFVHAETGEVTPFGRELLEEFPDAPAPAIHADPDDAGEAEIEVPFDPDAIREEILAAARVDAEHKVREAYQEGLSRGMEAGRKQFDASLAKCTEALEAAAQALQECQSDFLTSLEPQVLSLVKLLVARIIETETRTNPELLQHTVQRALEKLAGQYSVTLYVHPADLDAIRKHEISLLDQVPGVESLQIAPSEDVGPGGCIAQSACMEVDARLETLLGHVLDGLSE